MKAKLEIDILNNLMNALGLQTFRPLVMKDAFSK